MSEQGRWLETCGCGAETRIVNAGFQISGGSGEHPHPYGREDMGRVCAELGWCGCGTPESVDAWMLAYLDSCSADGFPKPEPAGVSADAADLLAYVADSLGWTEHGGSVGGAWLTENGEDARRNLRAALKEQAPMTPVDDLRRLAGEYHCYHSEVVRADPGEGDYRWSCHDCGIAMVPTNRREQDALRAALRGMVKWANRLVYEHDPQDVPAMIAMIEEADSVLRERT